MYVSGRVVEIVTGLLFVYSAYARLNGQLMGFLAMPPTVAAGVVIFVVIGVLMLFSRPHIVVVVLALASIVISLSAIGFFNSYSVSYVAYWFGNNPAGFLDAIVLPLVGAYWAFRGGFY